MILTIDFPDFLDPIRKGLFSPLPVLGNPCTSVKALFRVQVDRVSEKVVNPQNSKTWGEKKKLKKKRTLWQESSRRDTNHARHSNLAITEH